MIYQYQNVMILCHPHRWAHWNIRQQRRRRHLSTKVSFIVSPKFVDATVSASSAASSAISFQARQEHQNQQRVSKIHSCRLPSRRRQQQRRRLLTRQGQAQNWQRQKCSCRRHQQWRTRLSASRARTNHGQQEIEVEALRADRASGRRGLRGRIRVNPFYDYSQTSHSDSYDNGNKSDDVIYEYICTYFFPKNRIETKRGEREWERIWVSDNKLIDYEKECW